MRTNSFLPTNLLVYLRISLWELSLLVGLKIFLSALPSNNTQASKDSSKPEPRTSGLCYCTQLRWHPTVHGDSNRISRGLKETNLTCCVLSEDFPHRHHLHQVPLSLIIFPQRLSSSFALGKQHSQPNQFNHIQQSNHFYNASVSVSEREETCGQWSLKYHGLLGNYNSIAH